MNIALIAHDNKKELMVRFCTAYAGIFAKHTLCGTSSTAAMISEETGLHVRAFMMGEYGGSEQIGVRIAYNEIDLVICFHDPGDSDYDQAITYLSRLCDQNTVPFATNAATAEVSEIPPLISASFGAVLSWYLIFIRFLRPPSFPRAVCQTRKFREQPGSESAWSF